MSLSSKLGKLQAVKTIPRVLRTTTQKTTSVVTNSISSPKLRQFGLASRAFVIDFSRKSARDLKTTLVMTSSSAKKGVGAIRTNSLKPLGKSLTTEVPNTISQKARATQSRASSFQKRVNFSARMGLAGANFKASLSHFSSRSSLTIRHSAAGMKSATPKMPKISLKMSAPQLNLKPKSRVTPVEPVLAQFPMLTPVSENKYPLAKTTQGTNSLSKALNDFSSLPLWLTMPMLFATSFVLGAIVSFLVK